MSGRQITVKARAKKNALEKTPKNDFVFPHTKEPIKELLPRQEKFCQLYASNSEFFGNGVQSYIKAYNKKIKTEKDYNIARALAARLLSNENVMSRVAALLDASGFNDANIDKQHLFIINQHRDLPSKLGAIREYNRLKKRIEEKQTNITVNALSILAQQAEKDEAKQNISPGIAGALGDISDAEVLPDNPEKDRK